MKTLFLPITFLLFNFQLFSQETIKIQDKYTAHNKGKFFVSWGANRETYSKSDIHFRGTDYDFIIYDVSAKDKPKGFHIDFINPRHMTVPQTNLKIEYLVNDHFSVAIGVDHMKYVMYQDIAENISGNYPNKYTFREALSYN